MKILAIIQSRLDSERLPNKGLLPIKNIPLTVLVAKRIFSKKYKTLVATTTKKSDDDLCKVLEKNKIDYFRGSNSNVRKRFLDYCKSYNDEDIIVRLTADNCFPDKNLVEKLLKKIKKDISYIYINNIFSKVPYGLSVEAFKLGYLRRKKIKSKNELEHITLNFDKKNKFNYKSKVNMQNLRCTIDTVDDYVRINQIFQSIKNPISISWKKLCNRLYKNNNKDLKINQKKNNSISKLVLGCAQIGYKYGYTNKEKIITSETEKIFKFCEKVGISQFDTAESYGISEKIIGKNLRNNPRSAIDTKIYFDYEQLDNKNFRKYFYRKIIKSNKKIKKKINTLYLHNPSIDNKINNRILGEFNYYKKSFFLNRGISFDKYSDFRNFSKNYPKNMDVVQIPHNILDHRWRDKDFVKLKKDKIKIAIRSIFLQGLLTSDDVIWPKNLSSFSNQLKKKINFLVKKFNRLNFMDLCISYINSINHTDKIIIGVNSLKQLTKVYYLMNLRPLNNKQKLIVQKTFSNLPIQIIQPSKWKI